MMKRWMLIMGLAAVVSGADSGARRRSLPWEKNHLLVGQALFRENCAVCHDIDREQSKKPGPSFYQLFKRSKMPLGNLKPSREYIKVRAKFGGTLMPAFRQTLTDSEIDTLIDYIAAK
jgi:mono/diheme cytochrome c family protein